MSTDVVYHDPRRLHILEKLRLRLGSVDRQLQRQLHGHLGARVQDLVLLLSQLFPDLVVPARAFTVPHRAARRPERRAAAVHHDAVGGSERHLENPPEQ